MQALMQQINNIRYNFNLLVFINESKRLNKIRLLMPNSFAANFI